MVEIFLIVTLLVDDDGFIHARKTIKIYFENL